MHHIGGIWVEDGERMMHSENPADGSVIWSGNAADPKTVGQAVAAARSAFPDWAASPLEERLGYLEKFKTLCDERKEELAGLIARETGKVLWDAKGEAAAVIGKLGFTAAAYHERTGEKHVENQGVTASLRHRPHGVMAVFGPYNFPAHLPNGHIMPALLAGNTVVFKPSELTPAAGEWMMRLWEMTGLPSGVMNLVQGERETGIALAGAGVDGILFTGSANTGRILHKQFGGRPEIMLALEMGGNNPLIVADVGDVKAAVYETIQSAFITSGQRCTCARRLVVIDSKANRTFVDALVRASETIKVGAYTDSPEPYMGPLVGNAQADMMLAAQERLVAAGGNMLLPMRRLVEGRPFISPGIVDSTQIKARVDEEYFGPLLQVFWVKNLEDAIAEANRTAFGLSAGVFTQDPQIYKTYLSRSRAGVINWNRQTTGASGGAPFGGVGCSGNHRPSAYYAADYCAYPAASMEQPQLKLPATLSPGITL